MHLVDKLETYRYYRDKALMYPFLRLLVTEESSVLFRYSIGTGYYLQSNNMVYFPEEELYF